MFRYAMLAAAVVVGAVALGAEAPKGYEVRLVGIQVATPVPGDEFSMRPFNSLGTSVSVRVEANGPKSIIKLDTQASKLTVLRDDKGTDLTKEPPAPPGKMRSSQLSFEFPQVSKDGKSLQLELRGAGVPAKGSMMVQAQGALRLLMASQKKTDKQAGVALKKGTEVKAGPAPLKIQKVEPEDEGVEITFQTNEKSDGIIAIRLAKDGKQLESRRTSLWRITNGGPAAVDLSYYLETKKDVVDIEVEYWTDMEAVDVPVNVQAGLGL